MEFLVTGASDALGRRVSEVATARGHVVHRSDEVFGDVDAVIHCESPHRQAQSVRLGIGTAARSGAHVVFPGVVGAELIPLAFYRAHARAEEVLTGSGVRFTIRRFTQFHDQVWAWMDRLTRPPVLAPVPHGTRFQVLDRAVAAEALVAAAESKPGGRLPDLGGPTVYDARELAHSVATALGRRRRVIGVNLPGLAGAALRAGANLTENRDRAGETWNDFVAARLAP